MFSYLTFTYPHLCYCKLCFRDIFVSIYNICAFLSTGSLMCAVNSKLAFWFAFLLSFPIKYMFYRNPILKI